MPHILPGVDSVGLKYQFCGTLELKFPPEVPGNSPPTRPPV